MLLKGKFQTKALRPQFCIFVLWKAQLGLFQSKLLSQTCHFPTVVSSWVDESRQLTWRPPLTVSGIDDERFQQTGHEFCEANVIRGFVMCDQDSLPGKVSATYPPGCLWLECIQVYQEDAWFVPVSICGLVHHLKRCFLNNLLSKLERILEFISPASFGVRPNFIKTCQLFESLWNKQTPTAK